MPEAIIGELDRLPSPDATVHRLLACPCCGRPVGDGNAGIGPVFNVASNVMIATAVCLDCWESDLTPAAIVEKTEAAVAKLALKILAELPGEPPPSFTLN